MNRVMLVAALCLAGGATGSRAAAPLHDPVALNIGVNCQWNARCMAEQRRAMTRALSFVGSRRAPAGRIHTCNRNAARGRNRVDWVGFDHCIHNPRARSAPRHTARRR